MRSDLRVSVPVLAVLAAALGGCTTKLTVRHHPSFYDPSLKTVAVLPFANATLSDKAGEFLADRLAEALKANGTYQIVGPRELPAPLAAAGQKQPGSVDLGATAAALRELGGVDAFLVGTVRNFSADHASYLEVDDWYPGFGWGYSRWGRYYGYGGYHRHGGYGWYGGAVVYRRRSYTHALVAADAALVRVSDGKMIHATPGTLTARVQSDRSPSKTRIEALVAAARAVAARLVDEFAVTSQTVKISKGKTLRTARPDKEADKLDFTGGFRIDEEVIYVLLTLPAAADRNEFRLTITPKGRDEPLAEETVRWSAADESVRLTFSPRELADAAGGPGKFDLRLYAGEKLVLKRGFQIKD